MIIQSAYAHGPSSSRSYTLPRPLIVALYATFALFYASGIYDHNVANILWFVKWVPLFVIFFIAIFRSGNKYPRPRNRGIIWGEAVVLLSLISINLFFSVDVGRSIVVLLSVISMILASQVMANMLFDLHVQRKFFSILSDVGRVVIVLSFVMWIAGISLGRGGARFDAWTDNPNTLGMMLAPTMVILMANVIERRPRWVYRDAAFLAAAFIVLLATGSRASLLWVGVSAFSFLMIRKGMGIAFYFGVLFIVVIIGWWEDIVSFIVEMFRRDTAGVDADVLSGRSEVWALAFDLIAQRPVLGYGLGTSKHLIWEYSWMFREHQGGHFHNSYLTILVETGVIGFAAFFFFMVRSILKGMQLASRHVRQLGSRWPTAVLPWVLLVGALAHGMFETWILSAGSPNGFLFWTCLWLLHAAPRKMIMTAPTPHARTFQ